LCIDDLRLPGPEAIRQAAEMGYQMVEIGTVGTEFEPRRFGQTARRHLRRYVLDLNMEIAALGVDIGGRRFADPARLEEAFDRTRAAMEMAAQIRVPIVVVELGPVGEADDSHLEALRLLGQIADATGTFLALLTGQAGAQYLAELIKQLDCPMIRVCYDPAALLLAGYEPLAGIEHLADQIILAHVRDAVGGSGYRTAHETPLGEGQIDLAEYIAYLHEAGYFGPQIVRRLHAENPLAELAKAREVMASFVE